MVEKILEVAVGGVALAGSAALGAALEKRKMNKEKSAKMCLYQDIIADFDPEILALNPGAWMKFNELTTEFLNIELKPDNGQEISSLAAELRKWYFDTASFGELSEAEERRITNRQTDILDRMFGLCDKDTQLKEDAAE